MTAARNEINEKSGAFIRNYADDELILRDLCSKCQSLEAQRMEMLKTKQSLLVLNEEYKNISKNLLKIKSDCDYYKSHLSKTLHHLKVTAEKQKITSKKKLDEFLRKRKEFEEYYKVLPINNKLDELVNGNMKLQKEYETRIDLLNLLKRENDELMNFLVTEFKKKVCEFAEVVLKFRKN